MSSLFTFIFRLPTWHEIYVHLYTTELSYSEQKLYICHPETYKVIKN